MQVPESLNWTLDASRQEPPLTTYNIMRCADANFAGQPHYLVGTVRARTDTEAHMKMISVVAFGQPGYFYAVQVVNIEDVFIVRGQ